MPYSESETSRGIQVGGRGEWRIEYAKPKEYIERRNWEQHRVDMNSVRHWVISGGALILVGALGATLANSNSKYPWMALVIALVVAVYLFLASIAKADDALDGKYWPEKDHAKRRVLSVLSAGFMGLFITGLMGVLFEKLAVTEPGYFVLIAVAVAIFMLLAIFWPQSKSGAATCSKCGRPI